MSGEEIRKIKRQQPVTELVFDQLKENIINGNWKPGDKIPSENVLSSLLGVSRMSVRVAIQRLAALGMLDAKVGEGTFVRSFEPSSYIREFMPMALEAKNQISILEFRKALESESIRLAIKRASDEEIGELREIYRQMEKYRRSNRDRYMQLDYDFHFKIAQMSCNEIFASVFENFSDILSLHYYSVVGDTWQSHPQDQPHTTDEHGVIMQGIEDRDEDLAISGFLQMIEKKVRMYADQLDQETDSVRILEVENWISQVLFNKVTN